MHMLRLITFNISFTSFVLGKRIYYGIPRIIYGYLGKNKRILFGKKCNVQSCYDSYMCKKGKLLLRSLFLGLVNFRQKINGGGLLSEILTQLSEGCFFGRLVTFRNLTVIYQ